MDEDDVIDVTTLIDMNKQIVEQENEVELDGDDVLPEVSNPDTVMKEVTDCMKTPRATLYEQNKTPGGSIYWEPRVQGIAIPVEGTYYDTVDEAIDMYTKYAKMGGFEVKKSRQRLTKSKAIKHKEPHFAALKCILRYVRGTVDFGLQLYVSATTSLVGYTDADWAGCPSPRMSTSGYCVILRDNILSWSAKRQHTISRSSAKAEYQGVANVVAKSAWIRNLLRELHYPLSTATLVYCDNVSVVYMSANPVQHQRTKHIEIDIHFVRDMVTTDHVRVLHVLSRFQYADIFTKGLPAALFEDFRSSLSVRPPPAQTARAY
nr:ribonuclease H-like domain-containing protein [Tanacetum cinerariifolium]